MNGGRRQHPKGPCRAEDCRRPLCVGYQLGHKEGYDEGYEEGFADGVASAEGDG